MNTLLLILLLASPDAAPPAPESASEPTAPHTVVTGTRLPRPVREVPSTIVVIPREEIAQSPSLLVDGVARAVPSLALFRRSSSLVADPSAQGVNLRGLGPSAVSRALVLLDGVPVNDPFGGWVYWRALPKLGLERIEIAPGGSSALYGNYGLGGSVQLVSRPIQRTSLDAEMTAGQFETFGGAARAATLLGPVGVALEAEGLSTAGHPVVAPSSAGPIDAAAPSAHLAMNGRWELKAGGDWRLDGRVSHFTERQNGGTEWTTAAVRTTDASVRARTIRGPERSGWEFAAYGRLSQFDQTRARIPPDRSTESLGSEQQVPTNDQGLSAIWFSPSFKFVGTHRLGVGSDARRIAGVSNETAYLPAGGTRLLSAGGEQQFIGLFVEDQLSLGDRWEVAGALRLDGWRNVEGRMEVTTAEETRAVDHAPRDAIELSPRLGALYRPNDLWAVRASAWRAFRAPTLNELYRPFQVGRIVTGANAELRPETVVGGEVGVELSPTGPVTLRATGFWNELRDPIANVTLPQPIEGMDRQRQNLGAAQVRGVEASADARLWRRWTVLLAWTFVDSQVTAAPEPALVGKELAQNPRHRATLSLRFDDPVIVRVALQVRYLGAQFEDDLNERDLPAATVVDLLASRRIFGPVEGFAVVENLLDEEYLVGRAGVDTIGQPFTFRIGLRLSL